MNPTLRNTKIRIDDTTEQASVIDVIRMLTGQKSNDATKTLSRLGTGLTSRCIRLRINGKGKNTPVCDAAALLDIIQLLPGKRAKKFQQKLHQRHSRSEKAWRTLMTTGKASREENGISVHATIASTKPTSEEVAQFFEMEIPESREGFVYFVRIRDTLNVKIGHSKDPYARLQTLQTASPYDIDLEQAFFSTEAFQKEQRLHLEMQLYHVRGEWFELTKEQVIGASLSIFDE